MLSGQSGEHTKMSVLNLDEVIALRNRLQTDYGVHLHMHDTCGGQTFSIDTQDLTEPVKKALEDYFSERGQKIRIHDDGYFVVH